MGRKVSRRYFFEEWHRICPYCGVWFPAEEGSHKSCCSVCNQNVNYCLKNNLPLPEEEYDPYLDYDAPDIEAELRGELPVDGLFESCSEEKIRALERGDIEALLRIKD